MKARTIDTHGTGIRINEHEKNGDAVIFIHCSGGNLNQWKGVIPYFKEDYYIITADMRGHGKSDKSPDDYSIDAMAGDVIGVMDELKIDRAHLIGSSMGAEIAASAAANYPRRVISIVCEGAMQNAFGQNGQFDAGEEDIESAREERLDKIRNRPVEAYDTREEMLWSIRSQYESFGYEWNHIREAMEAYDICETQDGRFTSACTWRVLESYCRDFYTARFEDYYRRVECPVLFLPDEEEARSDRCMASIEAFSKLLGRVRVAFIKGVKHAGVMIDIPEEYSRVIRGFHREIGL